MSKRAFLAAVSCLLSFAIVVPSMDAAPVAPRATAVASSADWPDWRGPARDGTSAATGLPESWSPDGDNVAWTAPYGGRSAPVVFGDRLYLQNAVGAGAETQERILALDADTGELVWEHRFNVTLSDAPPRRAGWSSPVVDPATGNVYALGVSGTLFGLSPAGELLWERYLSEVLGLVSTHGGRTVSPIIVAGNVVVGGVTSGWGALARGMHRFMAFDKDTGDIAWVSSTGTRAFDTTYSPPIVRDVGGRPLVIAGAGDGAVHAYKPATGQLVWRYAMSKRGINTAVVLHGDTAIVSHGEENLEDSTMGRIAAVDAAAAGELGPDAVRWTDIGPLAGYSSPVLDGDRYYQIDNSANLLAIDAATGERLWSENLGTIQRASPVLADGKLYVGTQNGTFYILRPSAEGVQIIDRDELSRGNEVEEIIASVAVARGRVYLVTHARVFAIGAAGAAGGGTTAAAPPSPSTEPAAVAQIFPQEQVLSVGGEVSYEARLFDADGRWVRTTSSAEWSLDGIGGTIDSSGHFTAGPGAPAGTVNATVDGLQASARIRVLPPLPWHFDFNGITGVPGYWISALGKFRPGEEDGEGVLVKTNDNPFLKRTKVFLGTTDMHDYTVQVDFRSALERRRMGDAGLIAQRYALIAFGTKRRLELQSWQPETERTVVASLALQPDTWYRMKLRTQNLDDGVLVQGKVWPRDEAEPESWTIEKTDRGTLANRHGSPGLYADAHAIVTFDNLTVESNH